MKRELGGTLKEAVKSTVGIDILLFLERNPQVIDTAEGIALRIYRDPAVTNDVLGELCRAGCVEVCGVGQMAGPLFHLREGGKVRAAVHGLAKAGERSGVRQ